MNNDILVQNIEILSSKKGENKTNVLKKCGAGKNFISNLLSGSDPSIGKIEQIADYFGVSIDYLLGRTAAPKTAAPSLTEKEQQFLAAYKAHPELQFAVDKLLGIDAEDTETVRIAARSKDNKPITTEIVPKSKVKAAVEDDSIQSDEDL